MRIFFYLFIFSSCLFKYSVHAHDITQIHNLCLTSKDYEGCSLYQIQISRELSNSVDISYRKYGPLRIPWSKWRAKNKSLVSPALNKDGNPLYIAVNCFKSKINVTGESGIWKGWEDSKRKFEKLLIADLCNN